MDLYNGFEPPQHVVPYIGRIQDDRSGIIPLSIQGASLVEKQNQSEAPFILFLSFLFL